MRRTTFLTAGILTLVLVWLGPLPRLAPVDFSAHMTMHMGVVAVAAPLLALGAAGGPLDLARRFPRVFSPIPASVIELAVVWAWHAPGLHHAARSSATGLIAEQSMFLLSGLLVWLSSFGGDARFGGGRAGAGVVALLLTSMHMTLLGALLALSPRALYVHASVGGRSPLDEQHLGGAIMLVVGGISYLAGGLWLAAALLGTRRAGEQGELG